MRTVNEMETKKIKILYIRKSQENLNKNPKQPTPQTQPNPDQTPAKRPR